MLRGFNACTVVNGNISERFAIKRGCRQDDPISGYSFILCNEILALALKNSNHKAKNGNSHWQEQYSDDVKIFLEYTEGDDDLNASSIKCVLSVVDEFYVLSGLSQVSQN